MLAVTGMSIGCDGWMDDVKSTVCSYVSCLEAKILAMDPKEWTRSVDRTGSLFLHSSVFYSCFGIIMCVSFQHENQLTNRCKMILNE